MTIPHIYVLHRAIEAVGPDWFKIEDIPARFYPNNGHEYTVGEPVTVTVETTNADDKQKGSPRESDGGGSQSGGPV